MSIIGFRREDGELEYLEEAIYREDNLEDDLHTLIEGNPDLVMNTLTESDIRILGSKLRLQTGKEPDLLCCDREGTLTVIEFKRDRSPRSAVTQLFDYASALYRLSPAEFLELTETESVADLYESFDREDDSEFGLEDFERTLERGLESPQLLLVSYDIGDDVQRMVRWLRDVHDLKINCVEFDYYEKEDAEIYVPTVLGVSETQAIKEREESEQEKRYRTFFSEVLEQFKARRPNATRRSAGSDSWLTIPVGHSDINLVWTFRGAAPEKRLWVQMDFRLDDTETSRQRMAAVLEQGADPGVPEEIQKEPYGDSAARFYIEREVESVEEAIESEEIQQWAVDRMVKFYDAFEPAVETR